MLELQRAGILKDARKAGTRITDVCWRKNDGEVIADIDSTRYFPQGHPNEAVSRIVVDGLALTYTNQGHIGTVRSFQSHFRAP